MSSFYVYKHTSPSGKVYIGITSKRNPKQRWLSGAGYKEQRKFYRAIQKYGWDNIQTEIIAQGLSKEEACEMEIELIKKYDSTNPEYGYNSSTGGDLSALGVKPTDEDKLVRSIAVSKYWAIEEHRKHASDSHHYKNVVQYSLTGEVIRVWDSMKSVYRETGYYTSGINRCCNGISYSAYGYIWVYEGDTSIEDRIAHVRARQNNPRAVKGTNVTTNEVLYFDSLAEVSRSGFSRRHVYSVCNNAYGRKTHKGYRWEYAEREVV